MKYVFYISLIISLSVGLYGCVDDDDKAKTEYADKMTRYAYLKAQLDECNKNIISLENQAKKTTGDRLLYLQKQIDSEMARYKEMKTEFEELKKELDRIEKNTKR